MATHTRVRTKLKASLPNPENLRAARAIHLFCGWTVDEIRELGFQFHHTHLTDPLFDPVIDDIAVERAVAGDRAVWDALTHYERREVRRQVALSDMGVTEWCELVGENVATVKQAKERVLRRG